MSTKNIEPSSHGVRQAERIDDLDQWNAFVDANEFGLPLHHLDFLALLARNSNRELIPVGIRVNGGLEAVAPLVVERRGPRGILLVAKSVDFFDGLVPSTRPDHVLTHLDIVMNEAKRRGVGITTFSVFPDRPLDDSVTDELRRRGYEVYKEVSFVVPVTGRDTSDIRKLANRRIYRNLLKAQEHGVRVRDATEEEMEEIFPALERDAYLATGAEFPFLPSVFGEIWREYRNDSRFSMRSACVRDPDSGTETVIGMGLMVDNGRYANFWKLATRMEFDHMQPSSALYLDALHVAARKGVQEIDTGGAPSKGIAEYKQQWGARKAPYYYVRRVNQPLYQPIDRIRRFCLDAQRRRARGRCSRLSETS